MAIAFDAVSNGTAASSTSITWSHTCTGSDRILVVSVEGGTTSTTDVTSVTYNSVSLTKAVAYNNNENRASYLWILVAPATGANDVVVTKTSSDYMAVGAMSYTGASQTDQPDSFGTGTLASGTTVSPTTTVIASNCWLVGGARMSGAGGISAGANTTIRYQNGAEFGFGDSNGTVGTGSQSLNFVSAGTGTADAVVISILPVAPLVTFTPSMMMF